MVVHYETSKRKMNLHLCSVDRLLSFSVCVDCDSSVDVLHLFYRWPLGCGPNGRGFKSHG